MRKLIIILLLMACVMGCRKHVYNTYYGKMNIDTLVHLDEVDSNNIHCIGYVVAQRGDTTITYNPIYKRYYFIFPTNDEHGNAVLLYDPYTGNCTSNF